MKKAQKNKQTNRADIAQELTKLENIAQGPTKRENIAQGLTKRENIAQGLRNVIRKLQTKQQVTEICE